MPKKTNEPVKETQMVSLADIAFLIIFFFMLTSSFMRDKISVPLPTVPEMSKTVGTHAVTLDLQKRLFLDGEPVEDAKALESRLKGMLEGKTEPRDIEIRFKCDKQMKFKEYKGVYEAISNAGGLIAIMHEMPQKTN
ncbi:MAG: biopolymer transporter ExbD [Planctomycetota bacterium]|nr:biopolymer transporter ExbD [Planctomycetota bacterium]